jgi:hypothetical protein
MSRRRGRVSVTDRRAPAAAKPSMRAAFLAEWAHLSGSWAAQVARLGRVEASTWAKRDQARFEEQGVG